MKVAGEKMMLNGLLILGFFCTVYGKPTSESDHVDYGMQMQSDDDYQYDDENVSPLPKQPPADVVRSTVPPYATVTEYVRKARPGENAILECPVMYLTKNNVVSWKNGTHILTQGSRNSGPRVSMDSNNTLTIFNVSEWDSHIYTCLIYPQMLEVHAKLAVIPFTAATSMKQDGSDQPEKSGGISCHLSENTVTFLISFLTVSIAFEKLFRRI